MSQKGLSPTTPLVGSLVWYVYVHRRMTDGQIFYVGKGCGDRAWSFDDRNRAWKKMAINHGRSVEIVASFSDEKLALLTEQFLIKLNRATIVNIYNGSSRRLAIGDPWKHPAWNKNAWFWSEPLGACFIAPSLMWVEYHDYGNDNPHDEEMWIRLALGHIKRYRWWYHGKKAPKGYKS